MNLEHLTRLGRRTLRIFLDDERNPKVEQFDEIARSYQDFEEIVCYRHDISYVSFDHDLGLGKDGYDCAKFLVEMDIMIPGTITEDFTFNVHSANPVGASNIRNYMNDYLEFKRCENT